MKFHYTLLISLLITSAFRLEAKSDVRYTASEINDSLKKNANAIVRLNKVDIEIVSLNEVRMKELKAVTILNADANSLAVLRETYTNLIKLDDIKGRLYDADGKLLSTMKMKDASDFSSFLVGSTFHDDARYKLFAFDYKKYPYTVEYEVDKIIKTTFFLPRWDPQDDLTTSIEQANFTIKYPREYSVKVQDYLMPKSVSKQQSQTDKHNLISWELKNVYASKYQPYSREGNFITPTLILAPTHFRLLDYEGDMSDWKTLGKFLYQLNEGRDVLSEEMKAVVKRISDNEPDKRKKIQLLYEYMQKNTRYVANEYGISGWQTFDALSVGKTGYGDCKGLTNFMKAMLKEAGITAYTTLVSAGDYDYYKLDKAFPANTFNHVILCVPDGKDTVWVECTSQQLPSGYLGSFTQDRDVLIVTENGGILAHTPSYGADKSYLNRHSFLTFDKDKKQQSLVVNTRYSGLLQDDLMTQLKTQSEEKNRELLNSKFKFPSYQISDYKYGHLNTSTPCIEENVTALVSGISNATQKRTFINISWLENPMTQIYQAEERTAPFVLKSSFSFCDSVTLKLPADASIESLPKKVTYNYPFGTYLLDVVQNNNEILFVRRYQQNKGTFPASDYSAYQELYRTMENDSKKVGLVLLNH